MYDGKWFDKIVCILALLICLDKTFAIEIFKMDYLEMLSTWSRSEIPTYN